jgi:hypothetical protein
MTRISDVLVAWAVETQSQGEAPVDVRAALDRALAGARWHNGLLKKALAVVKSPKGAQP